MLRQLAEAGQLGDAVEVAGNERQAQLLHVVEWRQQVGSAEVDFDHVVNVDSRTQPTETQRRHASE